MANNRNISVRLTDFEADWLARRAKANGRTMIHELQAIIAAAVERDKSRQFLEKNSDEHERPHVA